MLKARITDFAELVWTTAARVGLNAPKVADAIIGGAFPATLRSAAAEGADKMFRSGVIEATKRVLRGAPLADDEQADFGEIAPDFRHLVEPLKSRTYFVESRQEYVAVSRLIADIELLDDARAFMRQKGLECIDEAIRLDALADAVRAKLGAA